MYIPEVFKCDDQAKMLSLIERYPLATLICHTQAGLEANHIPLIYTHSNDQAYLLGHIAKANPLHKMLSSDYSVLVTFQGPQAYVSAGFYPSKKTDPRVVPTWNYTAVHIQGRIQFIHEKTELMNIVEQLTNVQERQREVPWRISDAPQEYIDKMLNAIVGLRIQVDDMQGKWKVSQNQSEENRLGVKVAMAHLGNDEMSEEIAEKL